jgi:hypothetical protein
MTNAYLNRCFQNISGDLVMPPYGPFGHLLPLFTTFNDTSDCPHYYGGLGEAFLMSQVSKTQHNFKLFLGRFKSAVGNFTLYTCKPFAEKVMTSVTYVMPDLAIDRSPPPVTNEDTTAPFHVHWNATKGDLVIGYSGLLETKLQIMPWLAAQQSVDAFTQILLRGTRGIPCPDVLGEANQNRLMAAMDDLYGLVFALLTDGSRTNDFNPVSLNGTIVKSIESRSTFDRSSSSNRQYTCSSEVSIVKINGLDFGTLLGLWR